MSDKFRMQIIVISALLLSCLSLCSSHLCMLTPKQRGSITGLNTAGTADCFLTKSPCGGRDPEKTPQAAWLANGNYTVIFQKNLDHYTKASPGYFTVTLVGEDVQKELDCIPDGGEPSLHLYTVSGPLPSDVRKNTIYYVQVSYVTKNPQAPPAFYQCSDVIIL